MTDISRRFEEFIRAENRKLVERESLVPVKTDQGIMIGDVLIMAEHNLKTVIQGDTVYQDVFLNLAAVKIANLLALRKSVTRIDEVYASDQTYGKWFVESQELSTIYHKLKQIGDHERSDVIWAKYQESRDRAASAKIKVDRLCSAPINKL